jgi:MFS transporter, MHS family, proline/betaine transporter
LDFYFGYLHVELIENLGDHDMRALDPHERDNRPNTGSPPPASVAARERPPSPGNGRIDARLLKAVFATSLLNGLELFDFTVFAFFGAIVGDRFFPFVQPMTSLLLAAATFGVGFLARPLGGLLLGAYADRCGRQPALLLSCWFATLGTAAIALSPTYEQIGIAAPLLVVVSRVLQGLAVGGEIGPAAALAMEAAPPSKRGFVIGCQLAGHGIAPLFGASLGALLSGMLTPTQLFDWGWRVAFAMGLPLIGIAYYLRRKLQEGGISDRTATGDARRRPVAQLFRHHRRIIAMATLLMGFRTVPLYAVVYFLPTYMAHVIHQPMLNGFLASTLSAVLLIALSPAAGIVIDKLPRRKPLLFATACGTAIGVYVLFVAMTPAATAARLLIGIASITALIVLGGCAATVLVLEALPYNVRATGHGSTYGLGAGMFGGTAQLAVAALMKWTANPMSVAWYVVPCCLLSAGAAIAFNERRPER